MGKLKESSGEKKPGKTYIKYSDDAPEAKRGEEKPEPVKHSSKKESKKKRESSER